jgi:hypothetical protein
VTDVVDVDGFRRPLDEQHFGGAADFQSCERREGVVLDRGTGRSAPTARQGEPRECRGDGDRCQDDPGEG